MKKGEPKKTLKKFWHLLWKDDSLKGWIFSIIFLLIFIKFIFFPGLSLITGTPLPLAIVESCSMYHSVSTFNSWWERHENKYSKFEIEKEKFENFNMKNGFNKGDILFIMGVKPEKINLGDVVIFNAGEKNPIIHRVIEIKIIEDEYIFSTIGDNNNGQLPSEKVIKENQLVGRAIFKITPLMGWGKLIFYEHLRPKNERGFCSEN